MLDVMSAFSLADLDVYPKSSVNGFVLTIPPATPERGGESDGRGSARADCCLEWLGGEPETETNRCRIRRGRCRDKRSR